MPMRVNSLTSNFLSRARVPLALPADSDVIASSLDTCWRISRDQGRMVLIPNTLEITSFWVTPPLAKEVEAHPELTFETEFRPIPFDERGNLEQERLFPESQRARRPQ
jgi:hypothetical protein